MALGALGLAGAAYAGSVEIGPGDNLQAAVDALTPGDELVLRGGTYTLASLFRIQSQGTAGQPIVIRAKSGEVPVIVYPSAGQNTINVDNALNLILRGLEVTGGATGIRITNSSFVTIEDCHIHHTGYEALTANASGSSYQGLQLRRNHIHDAGVDAVGTGGDGLYLGCAANACRVFDSQIARNYIHHTNGTTGAFGFGIKVREGSYNNVVRDNVVHDTAAVGIALGGTAGGAPNVVERNFIRSAGDAGITAPADARIRNNIVLASGFNGIHLVAMGAATPANLVVAHNTVVQTVAGTAAVRVGSGVTGAVVIANNALFAAAGTAVQVPASTPAVVVAGNAGEGALVGTAVGFDGSGSLATAVVNGSYSAALPQDLMPAPGSLLRDGGDCAYAVVRDFNRAERHGTCDAGAYRFCDAGNPGWALAAAPMPLAHPRRLPPRCR
jgi:hypothetical protein